MIEFCSVHHRKSKRWITFATTVDQKWLLLDVLKITQAHWSLAGAFTVSRTHSSENALGPVSDLASWDTSVWCYASTSWKFGNCVLVSVNCTHQRITVWTFQTVIGNIHWISSIKQHYDSLHGFNSTLKIFWNLMWWLANLAWSKWCPTRCII